MSNDFYHGFAIGFASIIGTALCSLACVAAIGKRSRQAL